MHEVAERGHAALLRRIAGYSGRQFKKSPTYLDCSPVIPSVLKARRHVGQRAETPIVGATGPGHLIGLFQQYERSREIALLKTIGPVVVRGSSMKIRSAKCPGGFESRPSKTNRSRRRTVGKNYRSNIEETLNPHISEGVTGPFTKQPPAMLGGINDRGVIGRFRAQRPNSRNQRGERRIPRSCVCIPQGRDYFVCPAFQEICRLHHLRRAGNGTPDEDMLPNHVPETLVEKETMELQMLANEAQGLSNDRQVETVVSELAPEITPISMDCFKLVGGGSSIIVLE